MKKLVDFITPVKSFAAMMLAGLVILYMVTGTAYALVTGADFDYSIPFVFILQGAGLTMIIALLREIILSDRIIKKWRFFRRMMLFSLALLLLFAVSFFVVFAIPAGWAYLWLAATALLMAGMTVIFGLSEFYYKKTGDWYTQMLQVYKDKH